MKACVLERINEVTVKDIILRPLEDGEVLVKVHAAGICGSDIPRVYENGAHRMPLIIGHEFAGEIADVSDTCKLVSKDDMGARVGVFPLIPCSKCDSCMKEKYEMCSDYNYLGSRCDGGFAEYVIVPEWNIIKLSEDISYEAAAMLEPMAVAIHAIRQYNPAKNSTVLVYGLGTIGLLIVMFLTALGYENIFVLSNNEYKDALAVKLGIADNHIIHDCDSMENQSFDYIFECVGKNETYENSVSYAAGNGHIMLIGNPYTDMSLKKDIYWKILRNQLTVKGTWNSSYTNSYDDDWHYVIDLLSSGRINPCVLITHRFSLDEIDEALQIMHNKTEPYVKIMLTVHER